MLDVTTEDINQFVATRALKQMLVFHEDIAIESDNKMLEDSDEWAFSDDNDILNSDDEEINDSGFESD